MDIADLDWEDRERVLRVLFSKMNKGVQPPTWREDAQVQKTVGTSKMVGYIKAEGDVKHSSSTSHLYPDNTL